MTEFQVVVEFSKNFQPSPLFSILTALNTKKLKLKQSYVTDT